MYIRLQKTNERGAEQIWEFQVSEDKNCVITSYGQVGGKIRTEDKAISDWSPKNVGRSNEMSSLDQCKFEMIRKARKKIDSGYSVIDGAEFIDELTSKTVVKTNLEIPKPTLAKNASPYSTDHENSMRKIIAQKEVIEQTKLDGCLSGDSIVELENNGFQTIKDVVEKKIIDRIKSFDIHSNKIVFSQILGFGKDIEIKEKIKWFLITLEDGTKIKATSNHLFYINSIKAYRRCDELTTDDFLFKNNK